MELIRDVIRATVEDWLGVVLRFAVVAPCLLFVMHLADQDLASFWWVAILASVFVGVFGNMEAGFPPLNLASLNKWIEKRSRRGSWARR